MLGEKTHRFCSSFDCLRSYPVCLHKNTANLTDSKLQFFPLQKYGKNEWWAKLRNCSTQLVRNNVCELLFPHFFSIASTKFYTHQQKNTMKHEMLSVCPNKNYFPKLLKRFHFCAVLYTINSPPFLYSKQLWEQNELVRVGFFVSFDLG